MIYRDAPYDWHPGGLLTPGAVNLPRVRCWVSRQPCEFLIKPTESSTVGDAATVRALLTSTGVGVDNESMDAGELDAGIQAYLDALHTAARPRDALEGGLPERSEHLAAARALRFNLTHSAGNPTGFHRPLPDARERMLTFSAAMAAMSMDVI